MTDTAATPTARPAAFGDLDQELVNTRRLLERVPDEHWAWQPHEKSMTLGRIAGHLAELPYFAVTMLKTDVFDVATDRPDTPAPANRDELLAAFDQAASALTAAVDATPADAWGQTWSLAAGGKVFIAVPRAAALRSMGISHIVHHRGQLTVYLRLLGIPVPGLFGPSADEKFG